MRRAGLALLALLGGVAGLWADAVPESGPEPFEARVRSFMAELERGRRPPDTTARALLPELEAAVSREPENAYLRYALYYAYRLTRAMEKAEAEIERLYRHNPSGPGILANYCYHLERRGQWKEALTALEAASATGPGNPALETTHLLYLVRYQQYERAIPLGKRLLVASPEAEFSLLLGEAFLYSGSYELGRDHLLAAVRAGMESPVLYTLLGEAYLKAGAYGDSRYYLAAALREEPEHPLALYWWARLCERARRPEIARDFDQRARRGLEERAEEERAGGREWFTLGRLHAAAGQSERAAAAFRRAAERGYTREMPSFAAP